MSGCEAKVPALRFRMSHAESQRCGEGGRLSSTAENKARGDTRPPAPWVRKRLGDFGKPFNGLNGKTKADFGHGEGRYVTYLGIFSNPIVGRESCAPIEVDTSQNEVKRGDVFFTTSSETPDEVGMSAVWLDDAANTYLNSFCFGFRPNGDNDSEFLAYLFRSLRFRDDMAFLAQGISRYNISKGRVMNISVALPPDSDEQRRIGSFFSSLDALIAGREKALEKLEALKKSMLLKMFPQGDATVPEVRFKGFTGEWKDKILSEIVDVIGGGTPSTCIPEFWDGGINWFSPTEIGGSCFVGKSKRTISKAGLDNSSAVILPPDKTILFTSRATIGEMAVLTKPAATNQGFQSFIVHDGIDVYFLFSCRSQIVPWAIKHAHGSTFLEISKTVLEQLPLRIPSFPEQQQIGAYFRALDALLAARREEIGKLKQMKKALLERMFV